MKTNRFAQLLPVETVIGQSWASRAARSSLDSSQAQSLAAGLASYALQAKLRKIIIGAWLGEGRRPSVV